MNECPVTRPIATLDTDDVNVGVPHLGFLCESQKQCIAPWDSKLDFEIQNMALPGKEALGEFEDWEPVFRGRLNCVRTPMGDYAVGDFSALRNPGVYRVVLPNGAGRSYQFVISDGAYSMLPRLFLDYIHHQRCGAFENDWRGPCHLDDAVRSDDGRPLDVSGGWHDAGDTRKWMTTTPMAALGLIDWREKNHPRWNHWEEKPYGNDLLNELAWGARFFLKMQDSVTGMIYEDVGGGDDSRRTPGMTWWYEQVSGCYASNSDNRFTDNQRGTGDERMVRVQYNPIVQYMTSHILSRVSGTFDGVDESFSVQCRLAAQRCWQFANNHSDDTFHGWTIVRSWRLLAGLSLCEQGLVREEMVDRLVSEVEELQDPSSGWWYNDLSHQDFFRGISHSAQPVIALARYAQKCGKTTLRGKVLEALRRCVENYVNPMRQTNPFGFMPYGLYRTDATRDDLYRPFPGGELKFRFFMPAHSPQKINHGLAGHWTNWAHALTLLGEVLTEKQCHQAAWDQIYWLTGFNPAHTCFISGVGYRNPMPHSRFFGQLPGGFNTAFRGDAQDRPWMDARARGDWSSCEYWMVPLANTLMALSILSPGGISNSRKPGISFSSQH